MATSVTKWTKGAHTINGVGKNFSSMSRECTLTWVDEGTTAIETPHFDWVVDTDFTIVVNVDGTNHSDGDGLDILVQGSGTGSSTAVEWGTMATFSNVDEDNQVQFEVYDFDTNGRAPFMRLKCTPSNSISGGSGTAAIRIMIIPHLES